MVGKLETSNSVNVSCEWYFEFSWSKIPKFNCSVSWTGCEKGIARRDGDGSDPSLVSNYNSIKFEGGMPSRLDKFPEGWWFDGAELSRLGKVDL